MVSRQGMAIRFNEQDVRVTGRSSMGVTGMRFGNDEDEVIGMQIESQGDKLLVVSEKGMGKRTLTSEFKTQGRGGKGVLCYKVTEKTGKLIGAKLCNDDGDLLLITNEGIIMRTQISSISLIGRNTSGVRIMNIDTDSGIYVASITKTKSDEDKEDIPEETAEEDKEAGSPEDEAEGLTEETAEDN